LNQHSKHFDIFHNVCGTRARFSPALTVEERSVYLFNAVPRTECGSIVCRSDTPVPNRPVRVSVPDGKISPAVSGRRDNTRRALNERLLTTGGLPTNRPSVIPAKGEFAMSPGDVIRELVSPRVRNRYSFFAAAIIPPRRLTRGSLPIRFATDSTRGDLIARRLRRTLSRNSFANVLAPFGNPFSSRRTFGSRSSLPRGEIFSA